MEKFINLISSLRCHGLFIMTILHGYGMHASKVIDAKRCKTSRVIFVKVIAVVYDAN